MANNLEKVYYLDIDFLDYSKKNDIPNNIVYSESDINSTFIKAKLYLKGEPINLTDCTVTVGLRDIDDNCVVNYCEVINAELGEVKIPFVTSMLSPSKYNKFDISIAKEDRKIVSPSYRFKIAESVVNNEYIEGNPNYDVLTILIEKVEELVEIVNNLNTTITEAEQIRQAQEQARQSNESERISAENERKSQEQIRQSQEEARKLAEEARVSAEAERVIAEELRKTQELAREQAESVRNSQETVRDNAEKLRLQEEETRKGNELVRESNEVERMVAEEDRNSRFLVMEDKVNKFIRDEVIWEVVEG